MRQAVAVHLPARRTLLLTCVVSAAVVLLLWLAVVREWSPLLALDSAIAEPVHGWALGAPWAVRLATALAFVGSLPVGFVIVSVTVVLLLVVRRAWRVALAVVLIGLIAPETTEELKEIVERARPVWEQPLAVEPSFSFPSGHATSGLAVIAVCGVAIAWLVPEPRLARVVAWGAIVLGFSIGLSRIVLGVHWFSDVVGGWAVAVAVAAFVAAVLLTGSSRGAPDPQLEDEPAGSPG